MKSLRKPLALAVWLVVVALITTLMTFVRGLDKSHVALIYLLVVLMASAQLERPPALLLAVITFLSFNFFFLAPHYTFAVNAPADWLILLIYLVTAAVGAQLLHRARTSLERENALREADRLKDALLAGVSHDLRTPLTAIKAAAHDLRAHGSSEAAVIEEEADRLNRMVADLLDMSKLRAGQASREPQLNAVDDLIGAALQQLNGTVTEDDVVIHLTRDEPVLVGRFDFVQTLRIMVNLIENAKRFTPAGEKIEIDVRRTGETLILQVSDRGPGVPDQYASRIYEPFAQVTAHSGGAGLGLSIARGLAELQAGSLTHQHRSAGGTVFELRLPAADAPLAD